MTLNIYADNYLRNSLHLSMDGVPTDVDMEKIIAAVQGVEGVESVHHLHVWAISTQENALTGHLVVSSTCSSKEINSTRQAVKRRLLTLKINHSTLEIESGEQPCGDENC